MIPDEPTSAVFALVQPELLGTAMRLQAMKRPEAGSVYWDALPPAGEVWSNHRRAFMEAVYLGLAFCGTDTHNEWAVLGSSALILVRSLVEFRQVDPIDCYPLVFVGWLKTVSVYVCSAASPDKVGANEFFVGVDARCARGQVRNYYN